MSPPEASRPQAAPPRVDILVRGPGMQEAARLVEKSGISIHLLDSLDSEDFAQTPTEPGTLLAPCEALPQLHDLYAEARLPHFAQVLALCPSKTERTQALAQGLADDALVWPDERDLLLPRLLALATREPTEARPAAALAQPTPATPVFAGLVLDRLLDLLATSLSLQGKLPEAAALISDGLQASRAMILAVLSDDDMVYIMGDSDDAVVIWLPVPGEEYPEVEQVTAEGVERLYETDLTKVVRGRMGFPGQGRGAWLLCVPLVWDGEPFGALEVWFASEQPPPPAVRQVVRHLAGVLSVYMRGQDLFAHQEERTNLTVLPKPTDEEAHPLLRRYREFFEHSSEGIMALDPRGRILFMNSAGARATGHGPDIPGGTPLEDLIPLEFREVLQQVLEGIWRGVVPNSFDMWFEGQDGERVLAAIAPNTALLLDDVLILSFKDVTLARRLEQDLRGAMELLERLINSTEDGLLVTDQNLRVMLQNRGAERIFGLPSGQPAEPLLLSDLLPDPQILSMLEGFFKDQPSPESRLHVERHELQNQQGAMVPVSLTASLLYGEGQQPGIVLTLSDLSERLQVEKRLVQAQERLAATEKQALIAELAGTTAHELNQPLTSILGYAELLRRRLPEEDPNLRPVTIIMSEAERMANIVRKIGRITRYETKSYVGNAQILDLDKSSDSK